MSENYKQLVESLKKFKLKYLFFNVIRGLLLLFSILLSYFLIVIITEIFLFIKPEIKLFIFFISLLFVLVVLVWFLFIPFMKMIGIGKLLTHKEIAIIVKRYLPEVEDSLINSIELAEDANNKYSSELILASIDQKIERLKIFDFRNALKLNILKLFFLRFGIVLSVFLIVFLVFSNEMIDSTSRLIHYQSEFVKPPPFQFKLITENLEVRKGSGLKIELEVEGKEIPNVIYISFGGNNFLMEKKENYYSYEIENINNSFSFSFVANNYYSKQYHIKILPVPLIGNFIVDVYTPQYTNLKNENFSNVGNLKVPRGSVVKWKFKTFETSELLLVFNDTLHISTKKNSDDFSYEMLVMRDIKYSVSLKNENFSEENILSYKIEVIPDLFPQIEVVQIKDSISFFRYYFKGNISDDYGFSKLNFNIFIENEDSIIALPFVKSLNQQEFYFTYDFTNLKEENRVVNYYFSIFDNDVFGGFKETSSESFTLKFPDLKDQLEIEKTSFKELEMLMDESFKLNEEIRNDLNALKMDQVNSDLSEWEKQQKINEIVEKRKTLEDVIEEISKKNKELDNFKNSFSEEKADIVEKQKQIDELLKEVLSDELKKLFDEFNKLAKDFNSNKLDELTDDMDMQLEDLSKQLERNLEMLKRMKVVRKVQNVIDELNTIAETEKLQLNEFDRSNKFEKATEGQSKQRQKFELQKEEYSLILDFNKELKKPLNLADFKNEFDEIGEAFLENINSIEKRKRKALINEIKSISEKIENLAYSIQQMLDSNEKKQKGEDLENLKQILDNLIYQSVFQEQLIDQLKVLQSNDPIIKTIKIDQSKIINQTINIRDSLYSLANRNTQIKSVVNREFLNIQMNCDESLKMLEEGRNYNVLISQQKVMTSFNNLALFLSEIITKAEEEMANAMPGEQECSKPGKGKKQSMDMLKQSQESIKQQLQKMIDQMKSRSMDGMNKQLGKTLAQQEVMQQLIREMLGDSEVGSSAKEQLKMVDQLLETNKQDIITKNISAQTINRQNLILNKLLNAEMAELERDTDNERESKTASEKFYSNPDLFFQYKKNTEKGYEQLIKSNYKLEQYYDKKYKKYINSLDH